MTVGLVMPRMLNFIRVLAATFFLILMAMVVGVEGEVVLSPLKTLQLIPESERTLVL